MVNELYIHLRICTEGECILRTCSSSRNLRCARFIRVPSFHFVVRRWSRSQRDRCTALNMVTGSHCTCYCTSTRCMHTKCPFVVNGCTCKDSVDGGIGSWIECCTCRSRCCSTTCKSTTTRSYLPFAESIAITSRCIDCRTCYLSCRRSCDRRTCTTCAIRCRDGKGLLCPLSRICLVIGRHCGCTTCHSRIPSSKVITCLSRINSILKNSFVLCTSCRSNRTCSSSTAI